MNTLFELTDQAAVLKMDYAPFTFPLKVENNMPVFSFGTVSRPYTLTPDGMTYLLYRLEEFVDRKKARGLYQAHKIEEFVEYVNQCRARQEDQDLWRKNRPLILAVNDNQVWGVLTHYNPKSNEVVLNDLRDNKLFTQITRWTITPKEMNVYLNISTVKGIEIGLNIRNGETGHVTLGYHLYVKTGEHVFSTPSYGKRRHLSNMPVVDQTMHEAYTEIGNIKLHDFVTTTEALEYANMLLKDEQYKKLHEEIKPYASRLRKLYQLLAVLSGLYDKRGYKGVASKALDYLYTTILERI